jgi:hypothetical protein
MQAMWGVWGGVGRCGSCGGVRCVVINKCDGFISSCLNTPFFIAVSGGLFRMHSKCGRNLM